jgi:hypothetical protein
MDELQEMREQMVALKEKLSKQEIVSEQLMLQIVGKKLKREIIAAWVLGVMMVGLIIASWVLSLTNLAQVEWGRLICDVAMTTLMLIMAIKPLSMIKLKDVRAGKLVDVAKQMKRAQEYETGRGRWVWWMFALMVLGNLVLKFVTENDVDMYLVFFWLIAILVVLIRGKIRIKKGKTFYKSAWEKEIEQIEEIIRLSKEEEKTKK